MDALNLTPEHWIFIPSIFFLGWVVGFLMGQGRNDYSEDGSDEQGDS